MYKWPEKTITDKISKRDRLGYKKLHYEAIISTLGNHGSWVLNFNLHS